MWPIHVKHIQTLEFDTSETRNLYKRLLLQEQGKHPILCNASAAKLAVKKISNSSHPACGQYGLFSCQKLPKDSFIIDYLGLVTTSPSPSSDYVLGFVHPLSIDAEKRGNEARMINDYRGVSDKPNASFRVYFKSGQMRIGVFADRDISKEEILVSYGKSFWMSRQNSNENEE